MSDDVIEEACYRFIDAGMHNKAHELKRKYEKLIELDDDVFRLIEESEKEEAEA